jgi:5-methylcytosine-specific restriction endonuclease McrA
MTNDQLEVEMEKLVRSERRITNDILNLINLAEDRRLHLERGFDSIHGWLTKGHKYSSSAAWRRMEAARLLRSVPEASAKLESGSLNLTNLAKAHSSIRAQEKYSGRAVEKIDRARIVDAIRDQTTEEAERTLLAILPDTASTVNQERTKRIDEHQARLMLNLTNEDLENLEWIKMHLSHALPDATNGQIFARLLREFRQRTAGAAVRRHKIKKKTCEYKDAGTGRVCGSTLRVEVDHIVPRALGGTDDPSNLRCLCRNHNQFMAERELGRGWANAWRKTAGVRA